jgi:sulfide:quinone oxidoreductase
MGLTLENPEGRVSLSKRVVIIGGGSGGVTAALLLNDARREFGVDLDITVVNRDEWHYMPPLWADVALNGLPLERTRAPLRNLERKYGVRTVIGEVTDIDLDNREVHLSNGAKLGYDYLFIALGLRNEWSEIPGYGEVGYHNYSPEAALELNRALQEFRGGRVVIVAPEIPFRCCIYPIEAATILGYRFSSLGLDYEVTLLSPMTPKGVDLTRAFGKDVYRVFAKYFEKYKVKVKAHGGIEAVDTERKVVVTKDFEEPFDLLIKVPLPRPPRVLEDEDKFPRDKSRRFILARPRDFTHPKYDDVYLIGEHSMPPTGLSTAGAFVHAAAQRAVKMLLYREFGVGFIRDIAPVTCIEYMGDKGIIITCEITFNGEKYERFCYTNMESFIAKMLKDAFYQGWLDRLRA